MERSDAVDNQRRIRPALAYNQRSVELAGGQDADEIEELRLGHNWDCVCCMLVCCICIPILAEEI